MFTVESLVWFSLTLLMVGMYVGLLFSITNLEKCLLGQIRSVSIDYIRLRFKIMAVTAEIACVLGIGISGINWYIVALY